MKKMFLAFVLAALVAGNGSAQFYSDVTFVGSVHTGSWHAVSGISAVVGAWAGSKVSPAFGQGMLMGGMIQTVSIALNAFLPTAYGTIAPYATLGDLMNGGFTVPQNPLRLPPPPPPPAVAPAGSQARMNMNGLARAYGSAF